LGRQHPGEQLAQAHLPILGVFGPDRDELNLEIRRIAPHAHAVPEAENTESVEPAQVELCRARPRSLGRVLQDIGAQALVTITGRTVDRLECRPG
jgi:hypothetical protein